MPQVFGLFSSGIGWKPGQIAYDSKRVAVLLITRATRPKVETDSNTKYTSRRGSTIQYLRYTTLNLHPNKALKRNEEMPRRYKSPCIFYRVEDASSRAWYSNREGGIVAEDTLTRVNVRGMGYNLRKQLAQHLDWANRYPTPFLLVYSDEDVAWREAERRMRAGKKEVKIYEIDTGKREEPVEYRNVRKLAEKLDSYIYY